MHLYTIKNPQRTKDPTLEKLVPVCGMLFKVIEPAPAIPGIDVYSPMRATHCGGAYRSKDIARPFLNISAFCCGTSNTCSTAPSCHHGSDLPKYDRMCARKTSIMAS